MRDRTGDELLDCVEVGPPGGPTDAPADATVLWLHGLGADGHDFEPIVPELGLPPSLRVRFVFPHARVIPVTLNMGMEMRAWYDINDLDPARRREDGPGIRRSAREVEALIRRENARGMPASRIVLCGFSQGGAMATYVGLRYPEALAGIAALSSYLVLGDTLPAEASAENLRTPVLVCHGTEDQMVPERMGRAAFDRLRALGYDAEYHRWPMEHSVCAEEIRLVGRWIAKRIAARSAGTR